MRPDGDTEEFRLTADVLQGDIIAPFIFVTVLDYGLGKGISGRESEPGSMLTPCQSSRNPEKFITDFDIVYDFKLTSANAFPAQRMQYRTTYE